MLSEIRFTFRVQLVNENNEDLSCVGRVPIDVTDIFRDVWTEFNFQYGPNFHFVAIN